MELEDSGDDQENILSPSGVCKNPEEGAGLAPLCVDPWLERVEPNLLTFRVIGVGRLRLKSVLLP